MPYRGSSECGDYGPRPAALEAQDIAGAERTENLLMTPKRNPCQQLELEPALTMCRSGDPEDLRPHGMVLLTGFNGGDGRWEKPMTASTLLYVGIHTFLRTECSFRVCVHGVGCQRAGQVQVTIPVAPASEVEPDACGTCPSCHYRSGLSLYPHQRGLCKVLTSAVPNAFCSRCTPYSALSIIP